MLCSPSCSVTAARLVQPLNALSPMLVTDAGISMDVSALHPRNALSPMLCSPAGSVTAVRLVHPPNVFSAMLVTEDGISMAVRLVQLLNA